MIQIDFDSHTYICPFCGHAQAFGGNFGERNIGLFYDAYSMNLTAENGRSCLTVRWFTCSNRNCGRTCLSTFNRLTGAQQDIYPTATYKHYPKYIPSQIRSDYEEACQIISMSPKAAATLFRRCLQGMIRDFWGIKKSRLIDEIEALKDNIPTTQWKAIDALRKLGNIGAHMEKDVDVIIDIDKGEAERLLQLIEILIEKWYIARHDEESLYQAITGVAEDKVKVRKKD